MLKLSLLVGLFLPVATSIIESPNSPISSPLTQEQTKQQKALQILSFIQDIQNQKGLPNPNVPNDRATPNQPKTPISPIIQIPTPT